MTRKEILEKTIDFDDAINRIVRLEKENAELKDELKKWKDEWQEQVQKATDEGYARTLQTIQLNKAKEIIREYLKSTESWNYDFADILKCNKKAEQFLKDSEVKK